MIYADNAATTKITDVAYSAMLSYLKEQYGNASTQYSFGMDSKHAIDKSRSQFASALNVSPDEIFYTSGGTESNNWVLFGIASLFLTKKCHLITSSIEHHAVLNACITLKKRGVDVTYIPVDRYGMVSCDDISKAIQPNTRLVSVMLGNNEIGTLQPIAEIGKFLRNKDILFHTDAVQAVGHIPVDIGKLGVHFLSASAHKFNGPKGIGILYKKRGVELPSLLYGGKQEQNMRAGTENVAGIVGAGYAMAESISKLQENFEMSATLSSATITGILERVPAVSINGHPVHKLPGIVSLTFDRVSGESLMHLLDLKGICVSTGSACTSGEVAVSHVLSAIGLSNEQANGTLRISYGKYNNMNDVKQIVNNVCDAYNKLKLFK